MITDEKRAFKRIQQKVTVKFKQCGGAHHVENISTSKNISLGGMYFISLSKFEIGAKLICDIILPQKTEVSRWSSRVVRCENATDKMISTFGIAVEFIKAYGESEKSLRKMLQEQEKRV